MLKKYNSSRIYLYLFMVPVWKVGNPQWMAETSKDEQSKYFWSLELGILYFSHEYRTTFYSIGTKRGTNLRHVTLKSSISFFVLITVASSKYVPIEPKSSRWQVINSTFITIITWWGRFLPGVLKTTTALLALINYSFQTWGTNLYNKNRWAWTKQNNI